MVDPRPPEIDVRTLDDMRRSAEAPTVLDVREAVEREICALPGSLHIPMGEVPARLDELPRDGVLAVICHSGMRSLQVVEWLRTRGFANARNVAGGIDAWARIIDPAMPRY